MCLRNLLNKLLSKRAETMDNQSNTTPKMKAVAYIDLLAMSNFVRENVTDSIAVFSGYDYIYCCPVKVTT